MLSTAIRPPEVIFEREMERTRAQDFRGPIPSAFSCGGRFARSRGGDITDRFRRGKKLIHTTFFRAPATPSKFAFAPKKTNVK